MQIRGFTPQINVYFIYQGSPLQWQQQSGSGLGCFAVACYSWLYGEGEGEHQHVLCIVPTMLSPSCWKLTMIAYSHMCITCMHPQSLKQWTSAGTISINVHITKDKCILTQRSIIMYSDTNNNQAGWDYAWVGRTFWCSPHPLKEYMQLQSSLSHSQIVFWRVPVPSMYPMHVCRVTELICSILSYHQCLLQWV